MTKDIGTTHRGGYFALVIALTLMGARLGAPRTRPAAAVRSNGADWSARCVWCMSTRGGASC